MADIVWSNNRFLLETAKFIITHRSVLLCKQWETYNSGHHHHQNHFHSIQSFTDLSIQCMGGAYLLNNLILRKIYYKSYHSLWIWLNLNPFQNEIQSLRGRCRWCRDLLVNRTSKQCGEIRRRQNWLFFLVSLHLKSRDRVSIDNLSDVVVVGWLLVEHILYIITS